MLRSKPCFEPGIWDNCCYCIFIFSQIIQDLCCLNNWKSASALVQPTMNPYNKTVLLIQPALVQGQLWHDALTSQGLRVIWECFPEFDLIKYLNGLEISYQALPNAICLEVGEQSVMAPYGLCRWCSDRYPQIKLILINSDQPQISEVEEQWARIQGATILFPGAALDNLVPTLMSQINLVLRYLDEPALRGTELLLTLHQTLATLQNQSLLPIEATAEVIQPFYPTEPVPRKVSHFWTRVLGFFRAS
jgi:hypothetical protein